MLDAVRAAFATPRPPWFCDAGHCCECAEHEATLQARDLESLDLDAVGSPAWDPICFVSNPDGFKHLIPRLAELACGRGEAYYLDQFVFHLRHDRIETFTAPQKRAVEDLLVHLAVELAEDISGHDWAELEWALRRLRSEPGPCSFAGSEWTPP